MHIYIRSERNNGKTQIGMSSCACHIPFVIYIYLRVYILKKKKKTNQNFIPACSRRIYLLCPIYVYMFQKKSEYFFSRVFVTCLLFCCSVYVFNMFKKKSKMEYSCRRALTVRLFVLYMYIHVYMFTNNIKLVQKKRIFPSSCSHSMPSVLYMYIHVYICRHINCCC